MDTVVIVIHLMVVVALVAVVMLQRSEGGALGIGGGTPFMGARAAANVLTRATAVLAALFMLTSIGLTILAGHSTAPRSILDVTPAPMPATPASPAGAPVGAGHLGQNQPAAPGAPLAPAAPPAKPAPSAPLSP